MDEIILQSDEHIEYLSQSLGIVVSSAHTFGTDALLLAHFAAPRKNDMACDLGTGCGIIPMLWCRDGQCRSIDAVEIQPRGCDQLRRTVTANGLSHKLTVHNRDLKALDGVLKKAAFDLVTMNPPYKAENSGIPSAKAHDKIARHETLCSLDDICTCAAGLLRFGGKFCMCLRPERLAETMHAMSVCRLEPKRLRLICKTAADAPWLCLLEGRLGGKHGMVIERNLYVYESSGQLSAEMLQILGKYREEM